MAYNAPGTCSDISLVVKFGGSLYNHVPDLIPILLMSGRSLFIVPGGGPFADRVRVAGIDEESSHWMAIAAMDEFGGFIADQGVPATDDMTISRDPVVFLPYRTMRERDPLPHSWDITSDSIAAWVAASLKLDLVLLKSVDGIMRNGILQEEVSGPIRNEVVDPFFIPFVQDRGIKTTIINGTDASRVKKFLDGQPVPSTRIDTTFLKVSKEIL
jgi:hypothetical protein